MFEDFYNNVKRTRVTKENKEREAFMNVLKEIMGMVGNNSRAFKQEIGKHKHAIGWTVYSHRKETKFLDLHTKKWKSSVTPEAVIMGLTRKKLSKCLCLKNYLDKHSIGFGFGLEPVIVVERKFRTAPKMEVVEVDNNRRSRVILLYVSDLDAVQRVNERF